MGDRYEFSQKCPNCFNVIHCRYAMSSSYETTKCPHCGTEFKIGMDFKLERINQGEERDLGLFKGIVGLDCATTSVYYRDELMKLGLPKDTMKFGVFEKDGGTHVVLILDITKQLFKGGWKFKETKPV